MNPSIKKCPSEIFIPRQVLTGVNTAGHLADLRSASGNCYKGITANNGPTARIKT